MHDREIISEAKAILKEPEAKFPQYADRFYSIQFRVSGRLTAAAGMAHSRGGVTLSRPIFARPENRYDFRNTVLHEIAHIVAGCHNGHNNYWRWVAKQLGCTGARCHRLMTPGKVPVYLVCAQCGKVVSVPTRIYKRYALCYGEGLMRHRNCGGILRITTARPEAALVSMADTVATSDETYETTHAAAAAAETARDVSPVAAIAAACDKRTEEALARLRAR